MQCMTAAILICCPFVFSSCSLDNSDNPVKPEQPEYKGVPLVILDTNIGSSTDVHPIKQVYMNYNCDTGQKMWDPLAVIHAVEGDAVFSLSERGIVTLTEKIGTIFTPSATGHNRYQKPGTATWCSDMLDKIRQYTKIK